MDIAHMLFTGVLVPALICAIVLGAAFWVRRPADGAWGGAVAIGLSFPISQILIVGAPSWPPIEMRHWLPLLAIGCMVLGVLEVIFKLPIAVGWILRVILTTAAVRLLLSFMVQHHWSSVQATIWIASLSALTVGAWAVVERVSLDLRGPFIPASLAAMTGLGAGVVGASGSASSLQLAGAIAAGLGVVTVFSWLRPTARYAQSALPGVFILSLGPWFEGYFLSEASAMCVGLIVAAPFTMAASFMLPSPTKVWQKGVIVAGPPIVLTLASLIIAAVTHVPAQPSEYGY